MSAIAAPAIGFLPVNKTVHRRSEASRTEISTQHQDYELSKKTEWKPMGLVRKRAPVISARQGVVRGEAFHHDYPGALPGFVGPMPIALSRRRSWESGGMRCVARRL